MVTKRLSPTLCCLACYILAKNHMVTKLYDWVPTNGYGYILAKNHMVTKLR